MADSDGRFWGVGIGGIAGVIFGVTLATVFGPDSESTIKNQIDEYYIANPNAAGGKRHQTRRVKRHM
jgi:hypothetical protein